MFSFQQLNISQVGKLIDTWAFSKRGCT